MRLGEEGCGVLVIDWVSAGQHNNLVFGAAHFSQSASTLKSGDTGLTLRFGNACVRMTTKCYPRESFGSVETAGRM